MRALILGSALALATLAPGCPGDAAPTAPEDPPSSPGAERSVADLVRAVADGTDAGSALDELRARGAAAVPELIVELRGGHRARRTAAASGLEAIGPPAGPAVPALVEVVSLETDPLARGTAARALGSIGSAKGVPALEALRDDPRLGSVAQRALEAIAAAPPEVRDAEVPDPPRTPAQLAAILEDASSPDRASAVREVCDLFRRDLPPLGVKPARLLEEGGAAEEAMALLRQDLTASDDAAVRAAAARGLGVLGDDEARPLLIAALDDADGHVQSEAAYALVLLGPSLDALPALERVARDGEGAAAGRALKALSELGPAAEPAVPTIVAALSERRDEDARVWAAIALEKIGRRADLAVPALKARAAADGRSRSRWAAASALGAFGAEAAAAVPELVAILEQADLGDLPREAAAKGLAGIGPAARDALPALRRVLDEPGASSSLRAACDDALSSIDSGE